INGDTGLLFQLGFEPAIGSEFVIIDNDGIDSIAGGHFNGLAEGATFLIDNDTFQISYRGGDGNDVVVKRVEADTFTFAISAADLQVYETRVDANTRTSGPWLPTAPGQFREISAARRRPARAARAAPLVSGLGRAGQFYYALFELDGTLQAGWQRVGAGRFPHLIPSS